MWIQVTLNNDAEITLNVTQIIPKYDNKMVFLDCWNEDEDGHHHQLIVNKKDVKCVEMLEYSHDIRSDLKSCFGNKYKEQCGLMLKILFYDNT